ncbi:hypothetical protein PITC_078300 [Penicillium italicum]|uniref:Uncharacterized protein n=1 Tax=Penicillium italicum TaxID=40296 RepID=A0A0A2KXB7_PENIT|nr:hypothetical protein PITC_078300 [Penicillium italicum]
MISVIFVVVFAIFAVCSARPMEKRQANGPWSLYAYGSNIDGLPIFYADGQAQIGNLALSNATDKFTVSLTFGDNQNTWVAHPDTTATTNTTESAFTTAGVASSTNLLGLSDTGSMACPVIFTTPSGQANNNTVAANTSSVSTPQTNVWTLYGKYVMCSQDNVNFYAQSTGLDGWYILLWSATADAALRNIPVTLRTIGPASG